MSSTSCQHCRRGFRGELGLRLHLAKSQLCRAAEEADFDARNERVIESEDEPESSMEDGGYEQRMEEDNDRIGRDFLLTPEPESNQLPTPRSSSSNPTADNPPSCAPSVEDIPDEDEDEPIHPNPAASMRFTERYPDGNAGRKLKYVRTRFERLRRKQTKEGQDRWTGFGDEDTFKMVRWLVDCAGKGEADTFLKQPWVRKHHDSLPFKNAEQLLFTIDSLPLPGSSWRCNVRELHGDKLDRHGQPVVEEVEFWYRDILSCVKDLLGNPLFNGDICYEPTKVYRDLEGLIRLVDEAWTGDWMWDIQKRIDIGGTVVGVQIATDKTRLTNFSGNKQAYPVYLTINNISKAVRRRPNSHANTLVAYLPVPKLTGFKKNSTKLSSHNLFHDCMSILTQPLIASGLDGTDMTCADGWVRRVFPILACYVGDAPEQSLVTCTRSNRCPKCLVGKDERGQRLLGDAYIRYRQPRRTIKILRANEGLQRKTKTFKCEGLQGVQCPFWEKLPHCDIFQAITPDILHQLHQGIIGEHLIPWLIEIADSDSPGESDARFQAMSQYPGLRHFKEGFSSLSQRSGNENREIEKVMLGLFAGAVPAAAQRAARSLLDFCYYARWEQHDSNSLDAMEDTLDIFHANKHIFIELGVRENFDFQKLHALEHYVHSIYMFGTADGYNTETSERLHIDFAKRAYLFTNRRDFTAQMTKWLVRREKLTSFESYQAWLDCLSSKPVAIPLESAEHSAHVGGRPLREGRRTIGLYSTYEIAKSPGIHNVSIATITEKYHASAFLDALETFLQTQPNRPQPCHLPTTTRFDLYSQFVVLIPGNPQTGNALQRDRIRAVCKSPGPTTRTVSPELFSVVLVRVSTRNAHTDSTSLQSLQPARVRVIFELPASLRLSHQLPTKLAYVEWFTPLSAIHPLHGFRTTAPSWHSVERRERRASIIPIEDIVRAAHLQPFFGTTMDSAFRSESVMDTCNKFLFNPYVTTRTWSELRQ